MPMRRTLPSHWELTLAPFGKAQLRPPFTTASRYCPACIRRKVRTFRGQSSAANCGSRFFMLSCKADGGQIQHTHHSSQGPLFFDPLKMRGSVRPINFMS